MAAPAFGAIGTQFQASATALNVAAPSGVAVGDILMVSAFIDTAGATITAMPSGWANATGSPVTGPDNHKLYVMWKRADSGDTGASTFNFTVSSSVYCNAACQRFTGATGSGSPFDVQNSAGSNTSQTTTEDVATTTTVADTLLVWSGTNWSGGSWTPPSGFTERRDTGDGVCSSADKVQNAAGSTGAIVGTCTGSDKRCAWVGALSSGAAVPDSSSYSPGRLPGLIGPDGQIFAPTQRYDDISAAAAATNAPAGVASATGDALQVTARIAANAGAASGTGAANQSNIAVRANAGLASATGTAFAPIAAITVNAGVAQANGSAPQPSVSTSGSTNAPAGLAAATGTAFAPTIAVRPSAGIAAGSGAANQPAAALGVRPGTGSANGSALQATVQTGSSTNAQAGLAAGTGAANQPLVAVRANAGVAAAVGTAHPVSLVQVVTPDSRVYAVPAEFRTLAVTGDRTFMVPNDPRTLTVPAP